VFFVVIQCQHRLPYIKRACPAAFPSSRLSTLSAPIVTPPHPPGRLSLIIRSSVSSIILLVSLFNIPTVPLQDASQESSHYGQESRFWPNSHLLPWYVFTDLSSPPLRAMMNLVLSLSRVHADSFYIDMIKDAILNVS
jgi:hypothetical protein